MVVSSVHRDGSFVLLFFLPLLWRSFRFSSSFCATPKHLVGRNVIYFRVGVSGTGLRVSGTGTYAFLGVSGTGILWKASTGYTNPDIRVFLQYRTTNQRSKSTIFL
jgi:hypothetical protein